LPKRKGDTEAKAFSFLSGLFNTILGSIQKSRGSETFIKTMMDAGATQVISTRASTHQADAFLYTIINTTTGSPQAHIQQARWKKMF